MVFKQRDSADQRVRDLEHAIMSSTHADEQQRLERNLAMALAGLQGEQEAVYHIDFRLKDSKNWAVIHDLRIEHNGRVAQIDHVLVDRILTSS